MNLTTASKMKTIKDKKNSITNSVKLQQSQYITPSKSQPNQTPIKGLDTHHLKKYVMNRTESIHLSITDRKDEKELPHNALRKKCFQRNRTIKPIQQLEQLYDSQILSKTKYRFKPQDSLTQSLKSNQSDSVLSKKKTYTDKIPKNILATEESIVENSVKSRSKSKDSRHNFSQSKIIKSRIIRYE